MFALRETCVSGCRGRVRTLRQGTVTGGGVVKARRLQRGKNGRFTSGPSSNDDVTIVSSATNDCNARGAVCTEDGRMLSQRVDLTVSGPSG